MQQAATNTPPSTTPATAPELSAAQPVTCAGTEAGEGREVGVRDADGDVLPDGVEEGLAAPEGVDVGVGAPDAVRDCERVPVAEPDEEGDKA